jgi:hypothetical protein
MGRPSIRWTEGRGETPERKGRGGGMTDRHRIGRRTEVVGISPNDEAVAPFRRGVLSRLVRAEHRGDDQQQHRESLPRSSIRR